MRFAERTREGVTLLTAEGLGAPHGFSTRLGGVSTGIFAGLNLGLRRGDAPAAVEENYRRLCAAVGADPRRLVLANQVHGSNVLAVTEEEAKASLFDPVAYEADGLTTNCPGVALVVFSADCVPILLCDPEARCVAALHAGWRGTAAAIGAAGVRALTERYGARPERIRAAIGPAIGPCCFETDEDVPAALFAALGGLARPYVAPAGEKFRVDLKGINGEILKDAGVLAERIAVSDACTCCDPRRFWSHRYTHGQRGSQGAIIYLEEEKR